MGSMLLNYDDSLLTRRYIEQILFSVFYYYNKPKKCSINTALNKIYHVID